MDISVHGARFTIAFSLRNKLVHLEAVALKHYHMIPGFFKHSDTCSVDLLSKHAFQATLSAFFMRHLAYFFCAALLPGHTAGHELLIMSIE